MSFTPVAECPYPPVRRVVTGHDNSGKSIVVADSVCEPRYIVPGGKVGSKFYDLFLEDKFPISNTGDFVDKVKGREADVVSKGGSTFKIVDMPPGTVTPFHRTISLDYAAVVQGSIICQLNNKKGVLLKTGDVLIQRGTIHAWINNTNEWTRIFCVVEDAAPVEVNGEELGVVYMQLGENALKSVD